MRLLRLLLLMPLLADPAWADPGLVHSNVGGVTGTVEAGAAAGRTYVRPTADTPVLSCPPGTAATDCEWGDTAFQFRRFGDLANDALVSVCTADIPPGPFGPPERPVVDATCGDPCGCGGTLDKKANILKSAVQVDAPDPSKFSATLLAGPAPVSTILTWDVVGVTGCTASGSWTGAKAAKGTQSITGLTASAKYTLTCTAAASQPGSAVLGWQAPTQNTDGSALADLAGFRVVYGLSATALISIIEIPNPLTTTTTVAGLTPGQTWYFSLRAYTTSAVESGNSSVQSKAIAGTPGKQWVKSINIAVSAAPTLPKPPTGLSVSEKTT